MNLLQSLVLGTLQGLTEFLPISSSGHLVIVPALLRWPHPGLAFDVVVHLGTLLAVLAYFRDDWWRMIRAGLSVFRTRRFDDPDSRLAWLIALGCVPAAVIGAAFEQEVESLFLLPVVVGCFLLVTAVLLVTAEVIGRKHRDVTEMTVGAAMVIGIAQAVAIAPGISRSGATIAAALALGFARPAAARFSFLLSAPIIFGAGALQIVELIRNPLDSPGLVALVCGFLAAGATGYLCIAFLLRYLRERSLFPFAAYCGVVGSLVATNLIFHLVPQ